MMEIPLDLKAGLIEARKEHFVAAWTVVKTDHSQPQPRPAGIVPAILGLMVAGLVDLGLLATNRPPSQ
jgi:hypothetical protein